MTGPSEENNDNSDLNESNIGDAVSKDSSQTFEDENQSKKEITRQMVQISRSGPLPPPQVLEAYNQVSSDAADRIIKMAEKQSEHRRSMEKNGLEAQISISKRGQIFAFIISLVGIGAATFCAFIGKEIVGSVLGGGLLATLVSLFITGRKEPKKDRESDGDE